MAKFFDRLRGGITVYYSSEAVNDSRFIILHFGEDPNVAMDAFWRDHEGDFEVVPLIGYGHAPRPELCSKQSLTQALKTAKFDENSSTGQGWKAACERHGERLWPDRLAASNPTASAREPLPMVSTTRARSAFTGKSREPNGMETKSPAPS